MTVVVDASVLVATLTGDDRESLWCEEVLATHGALAAPALVLVEATNVLRRLELAGLLEPQAANDARTGLLALPLDLFPFEPFAERVWELRSSIASYDACYVALAEALAAPLATLDRRLSRSPAAACAFLAP